MTKIRGNVFIKGTIILIIGGFLTKVISMFIKIILARLIGTEGMGIYMLISPTFTLLMAVASLGFPVAISKLVAEDTKNNKNLVFSILPISLFINLSIMLILLFLGQFVSNNLLNEPRSYYALICIGFVLPFISISSILRGYFFGKQNMLPHVISNVTEDVIRLISLIIGIPMFIGFGIEYAVAFVVLTNVISELTSILVLFFFLPKNFKLTKKDLKPNKGNIKDVFNIGIPTTMSRLIGSVGFFFEPIILTYCLIKNGYTNNFIVNEYGIINGFIMPLILIPSFFTMAISQALIPNISKAYSRGHYKYTLNKIKLAIFLSLLIGVPATLIFEIVPEIPMEFIYNTTKGIEYIKVLAPICLFHYIQAPLTASLQAMGKAKEAMNGTLIGTIIRIISLFILCNMHIGLWALIWSSGLNMMVVTVHQYLQVKKALKEQGSK